METASICLGFSLLKTLAASSWGSVMSKMAAFRRFDCNVTTSHCDFLYVRYQLQRDCLIVCAGVATLLSHPVPVCRVRRGRYHTRRLRRSVVGYRRERVGKLKRLCRLRVFFRQPVFRASGY